MVAQAHITSNDRRIKMKKLIRDRAPLFLIWLAQLIRYRITGLFVDRSLNCYLYKTEAACSDKVLDWMEREEALYDNESKGFDLNFGNKWLPLAKLLHKEMLLTIRYCPDIENYDKKEYWGTSDEVKERGKDDCDGQAAYMYRLLRDNGFPSSKIGLTRVIMKDGGGHVFCCIFHKESNFYVLDNGAITPVVQLASDCLKEIRDFRESFTTKECWKWECRAS